MGEAGLRERKKERSRTLIRDTALRLFMERGFDAVTVAEIARTIDVSEATVFNYFPTKEDLVYAQMELFERELLEAVRNRSAGDSALAAVARFVFETRGLLANDDGGEQIAAWTRMITSSPALIGREHQVFAQYTNSLAALLAEETRARPGDLMPWLAANALIGVHRVVLDYTRQQALAGRENPALARAVRANGRRAIALLEHGLSDYAVKPAS
jgi:AcrR family transcriptional regulator